MRFLADENFPLPSVYRLKEAGHEVASVLLDSPGTSDEEVLLRASREERVILTFDRAYGRLLYESALSPPAGLVYFRFIPSSLEEPAEYLLRLMERVDPSSLLGRLTVAERDRVRRRPLPPTR